MRKVIVEWRHLDVAGVTCERCGDTGAEVREAVTTLNTECRTSGISFELREVHLDASALDESNAISIDGRRLETILPSLEAGRSECNSCGTLLGQPDVHCRTLERESDSYATIPAALIREAACRLLDCCAPACGCR